MNKKGISPLIGTVLLVGIVVMMVLLIMPWVIDMIEGEENYISDNKIYCNNKLTNYELTKTEDDYLVIQTEIDSICDVIYSSKPKEILEPRPFLNITYTEKEPETEEYVCLEDYDTLNYTNLGISREDFEDLECYRQIDWLSGGCFPSACNMRNPPICTSYYAVYCQDQNSKESIYFKNIRLGGDEE